ncbi:MAG TPA: hypothetical protein VMH79_01395 [Thermoanaerobaculia bacterium]|nr:hypothetical protein [Thermoanaerobaculia bacterium]
MTRSPQQDNVPGCLAFERAFLAWMRPGLSPMGFGFVAAPILALIGTAMAACLLAFRGAAPSWVPS